VSLSPGDTLCVPAANAAAAAAALRQRQRTLLPEKVIEAAGVARQHATCPAEAATATPPAHAQKEREKKLQ
jgi:hypothetical protein